MNRKIISLWSGPRNVSTALMYSFAQRPDMDVADEPLYAYYLSVTGADHPGKEEVIQAMEKDPARIWSNLSTDTSRHLFIKNMAHHAIDLNPEWYAIPEPVLLIRDPEEMLPSLIKQIPKPILRDTGLPGQLELLRRFLDEGKDPLVIESERLLSNPARMLSKLCGRLSIPYDDCMLSWPAGPRPEDGVWAKHWYHRVHESSGFEPYIPRAGQFPEELLPLLRQCQPIYDELLKYAADNE